jgi:thioredoxin reductase (NADPH)
VNITEIGGKDFVEFVKLDNGEEIKLDGVFVILEHIPTSGILADAGVISDASGCILSDKDQKTNIPGIFAAGDCSCKGFQIVTATGMGATAALNAMKYVKQLVRK